MSEFRCPNCRKRVGRAAPQGGLKMDGLAIALIKADGTVYGPCRYCRADVVIVTPSGLLSKALNQSLQALLRPRRSRRVVLVIEPEELTGDRKVE